MAEEKPVVILIVKAGRGFGKSQIDGEPIYKLPSGLRKEMKAMLAMLSSHGVTEISIGKAFICKIQGENLHLSDFPKEKLSFKETRFILETIRSLEWHLGEHWITTGNPGARGAPRYCVDCGHEAKPGSDECPNPECPSHRKRAKVMGRRYRKPEDKEATCFAAILGARRKKAEVVRHSVTKDGCTVYTTRACYPQRIVGPWGARTIRRNR